MTSYSNAERETDITDLSTTGSNPSIKEDSESSFKEEEIDDQYWEKRVSTKYYPDEQGLKAMKDPMTAPWDTIISIADVDKLKRGFKPRNMDDKWEILVEDPNENGHLSIHIVRFLLREECYTVCIIPGASSNISGGVSARFESLTWETNKPGDKTKVALQSDAEQAKEEALLIFKNVLYCKFETLPQYSSSAFHLSRVPGAE